MPEQHIIDEYYNTLNYFQGNLIGGYTDYDIETERVIPQFESLLDQIALPKNATILDIGCAYGTHLSIVANQSYTAWGIEISEPARQIAIKRNGDKIKVVGCIAELPKLSFDLILLMDVIEHLSSPYPLFYELIEKGHITEHTIIAITTPNARSIEAIENPSDWRYRYVPAHLIYYSAKTLSILFKRLQFKKTHIQGIYASALSSDKQHHDEHSHLNQKLQCYSGLFCITRQLNLKRTL